LPNRSKLARLAEFARALRDPPKLGGAGEALKSKGAQGEIHVLALGSREPSEIETKFIDMAYQARWVMPDFDWLAWSQSDEGAAMLEDKGVIASATEFQIAQVLTTILRRDRFVEGTFADAIQSGLILALADRAGSLVNES
jgi:hypothetical protein